MIPVRVHPDVVPHVVRDDFRLTPDHPLYAEFCPVCDLPLGGQPVALVFVGRDPDDRGGWGAAAVAVHTACTATTTSPTADVDG